MDLYKIYKYNNNVVMYIMGTIFKKFQSKEFIFVITNSRLKSKRKIKDNSVQIMRFSRDLYLHICAVFNSTYGGKFNFLSIADFCCEKCNLHLRIKNPIIGWLQSKSTATRQRNTFRLIVQLIDIMLLTI